MTDHLTENARLRAALLEAKREICDYLQDGSGTLALEMAIEAIDTALATPAPDAPMPEHERDGLGRPVNPAAPQEAVYLGQHSVAPAPDAVQEAARVPEIAALIEAAKAFDAAISTPNSNAGTARVRMSDALRAIAGDRT